MTNPNAQRSNYTRPLVGVLSGAALLFALQGSSVAETEPHHIQPVEYATATSKMPLQKLAEIATDTDSKQRDVKVDRTAERTLPDVYCWDGEKEFTIADAEDRKHKNIGIACLLATKEDWYSNAPKTEVQCLVKLWIRESQFDHTAYNKGSGATGIPQALPGNKMASAGDDWKSNPKTQIKWGLDYIDGRYETPCEAWDHSERKGWY
jgi:hypothetical protein